MGELTLEIMRKAPRTWADPRVELALEALSRPRSPAEDYVVVALGALELVARHHDDQTAALAALEVWYTPRQSLASRVLAAMRDAIEALEALGDAEAAARTRAVMRAELEPVFERREELRRSRVR